MNAVFYLPLFHLTACKSKFLISDQLEHLELMKKGHFMMHSQLLFQMQCTYNALIILKLYNIEDKLSSMGISAHSKHEILADIFGVTRDGI